MEMAKQSLAAHILKTQMSPSYIFQDVGVQDIGIVDSGQEPTLLILNIPPVGSERIFQKGMVISQNHVSQILPVDYFFKSMESSDFSLSKETVDGVLSPCSLEGIHIGSQRDVVNWRWEWVRNKNWTDVS